LAGLERYLTTQLGVPAFVVEEPEKVVVNGLLQILEHLDLYKQGLAYQE
jgi:actin-like ATPase involved in cell morphogenesis